MKTGRLPIALVLLGSLLGTGAANAMERETRPGAVFAVSLAGAASLYELADPIPLSSSRWDPLFSSRLELSAGLLPRHEVRVAAQRSAAALSRPVAAPLSPALSASSFVDPVRATYRYTFLEQRDWAWKVGITTRLADEPEFSRLTQAGAERARFGALPQVHLAGEGRLAPRWLLSFAADGLLTSRGRAVDLGVRVNYALTRSFSLFGGYRLFDLAVEGEENPPGLTNSANVGVRYRF
jgi:hypothetical protein